MSRPHFWQLVVWACLAVLVAGATYASLYFGLSTRGTSVGTYVVASRNISVGERIASADVRLALGRLEASGPKVVVSPEQAIGLVSAVAIGGGDIIFTSSLTVPTPTLEEGGDVNAALGPIQLALTMIDRRLAVLEQAPSEGCKPAAEHRECIGELAGFTELEEHLVRKGVLPSGDTSLLGLIDKAFDIGAGALKETAGAAKPLEEFLTKFAESFGSGLGGDAHEAVNALGRLIYDKLTSAPKSHAFTQSLIILFDRGQFTLDEAAEQRIAKFVAAVPTGDRQRSCQIAIAGHTDTAGSDSSNLTLSQRRADTIASRLTMDLPAARIDATRWGERRLFVLTTDGAETQENRRVEIVAVCD